MCFLKVFNHAVHCLLYRHLLQLSPALVNCGREEWCMWNPIKMNSMATECWIDKKWCLQHIHSCSTDPGYRPACRIHGFWEKTGSSLCFKMQLEKNWTLPKGLGQASQQGNSFVEISAICLFLTLIQRTGRQLNVSCCSYFILIPFRFSETLHTST